jgi:hypothetical protein
MRQFMVRTRDIRHIAAVVLLAGAACNSGVTEPREPQAPQAPQAPDAGIAGVSNAGSTVCAQSGAGGLWCTVADAQGAFRITQAQAPPGTEAGLLPPAGTFTVYNVACPGRAMLVDRAGTQRNGGGWLDVRCMPEGCVAPPSGLLAWYRFDEEAGDSAVDHSGAAPFRTLRLEGGAAHVPGRVMGGVEFPGESFAQGSAAPNLGTGDFSIAVWVRTIPGELWGYGTLLDKRDASPIRGYHILISGGEPLIQLADAGVLGGWYNYHANFQLAPDGQWHFLVVTVQRASRTGVRWYYDGVPAGDVADPTDRQGSLDSAAPLLIGSHSFYGPDYRGGVDELQIVNRVLSPAEIATLHTRHSCR